MMGDKLCAIAVMAKAPRAGRVKTRLVPPLTAEEAEALSGCFLRDVTENVASASRLGASLRGFVAFAPAGGEAAFDGLTAAGTEFVLADGAEASPPQVDGFGRCLLQAARALFAEGFGAVCLLNADSPNLPTAALTGAVEALATPCDRVVLGPAEDGGYYLIGMKTPHAELFRGISWSTERVAAQTRVRARSLGLEVVSLPSWYDVDDERSLRRLLADVAAAPYDGAERCFGPSPALATARYLAGLGIADRLAQPAAAITTRPAAEGCVA